MQRSAILTATLLSALGLLYGCTQDFNQFEPSGGTGGTGAETSSSTTTSVGPGGSGGGGAGGGMGGATSSSSVASSSSTGGMTCMNNGGCPADTACSNWSCTQGMCTHQDDADGTPTPTGQTTGDCKQVVCDGMGGEKTVNDDSDVPASDNNPCTDQTCSNGTPMFPNRPAGTMCPGGVCDGMGTCVECGADGDCTGTNAKCIMNKCVSCSDGMKNGDETGTDCGGTYCKKCNGDTCAAAADCVSGSCADGVCCNNDCTGTCKACNIAGNVGTCDNIASGTEDPNATTTCTMTSACNGAGLCKLKAGEKCTANSECLSNSCMGAGGNKTCQP